MKHIVVAPVGDHMDALFVGIREFPTKKVVLVASKEYAGEARKAERELKKFKIPVTTLSIGSGNIWEETFKAISQIKSKENDVIVNVATGDRNLQCAATSAAFVNGLKAFNVQDDNVMMLPVLKFSYYRTIPERKLEILKTLFSDRACCKSFEELSQRLKMSLPLVSYHINGNVKSEGLKQMGLVSVSERKGRSQIGLTSMGKLLIEGHVQ